MHTSPPQPPPRTPTPMPCSALPCPVRCAAVATPLCHTIASANPRDIFAQTSGSSPNWPIPTTASPVAGFEPTPPQVIRSGEFQPFLTFAALPQGCSVSILGIQEPGDAQQRPDPELR